MRRFQNKFFSLLFAVGAFSFLSVAMVFGDTTISVDTQLTGDADYAGIVTIDSGITLDLNGYTLGTVGSIGKLAGTGTITNTSETTSTLKLDHTAGNTALAPAVTGNIDFIFNPTGDIILRLRNASGGWTGSTTINGGRLHVDTQDCIGTGTIYLNGNLVNDDNGHKNLVLSNPVEITGSSASIRAAYSASITLTGKVSDHAGAVNPRLTIGAKESVANTYKLYGENDYTCGTWIGDASYTGLTLKIYAGAPTAFGTGPIQMVSSANLTLEKHDSTTANSLANTIHLGGKTLTITNSTGGAITISSAIDNLNSAGSAVETAGNLTINGNDKAVTLSGAISGAVNLSLTNKNGFTFSGSAGDGASLSFKTTGTGTISGAITGTATLTFDSNSGETYYRLTAGAQDRTGATYINGGNNTRVHVSNGASLGTGEIYLNGNLCNNSDNINVTFSQPVLIAGSTASIRAAYGGSITLNGKISDMEGATNPKFTIAANESNANTYKLYGDNDYTCGTWIGISSYANLTQKISIGTPTAFGTGPIQMVSNANLTLEKTSTTTANSLANTIHLGGKKLNVTNSTGGAITFTTPVDNLNASGASVETAGTLAINGGDYAVTFSGDITGNAAVSITGKNSVTFDGTLQDNASLSFKTTGACAITGTLIDAGSLTFDNNGAAVYYRVNGGAQNRTGATYINGGDNTRVHVSYGSYLGTGPIYLNGNLCNNSNSARLVTFSQPIVINGENASLRVAYVNDDAKAMMKVTGVISSDPAHDGDYKLTFNAVESGPGPIFLYGENTFTCPSYLASANNSNKLVLGTDSSLGGSTLTASGSGTLYLETNEAGATRMLGNTLKIAGGKTLRLETVSTTWDGTAENSRWTFAAAKGDAVVSSTITGASGSQLIFGSGTAAMNTGPITFSGTAGTEETPLAVSVTAGQTFISDEALVNGTLTMNAASTLEIPTSLKVTGDMTAPKTIQLAVDDSSNAIILDVGGTLILPGDADIQIAAAFESPDPSYSFQVLSANSVTDETGAQYTPAQLLAMIPSVLPTDAGWDYVAYYANNGIGYRADLSGVPEPATWVLLLLGLTGLVCASRRNARKAV